MKTIIPAAFAAVLAGCSGPVSQWASAPLSPATDFSQMGKQIKANPEEWAAALKFLQESDLNDIALGRHDITDRTYANVQEYTSKTENGYEAHRLFIDIQIVISGEENIFVAPLDKALDITKEYDAQSDCVLFADASDAKAVPANPESWVVLFPNEAHKPGMAIAGPAPVRKVVVKIPVAE